MGVRYFAGDVADAYLVRADIQRGLSVVVWRGRHVVEPTELSDEEAVAYGREVLAVGRALETTFSAVKMNYNLLGNWVPHLHTHVVPRYARRPASGLALPVPGAGPGADAGGTPGAGRGAAARGAGAVNAALPDASLVSGLPVSFHLAYSTQGRGVDGVPLINLTPSTAGRSRCQDSPEGWPQRQKPRPSARASSTARPASRSTRGALDHGEVYTGRLIALGRPPRSTARLRRRGSARARTARPPRSHSSRRRTRRGRGALVRAGVRLSRASIS